MKLVTTIGFDADDTLWHHERHYKLTEGRFRDLLADYAAHDHLEERLRAAELRNLAQYGYGVKGFTLSMIETAIEVTEGRAPAGVIAEILEAGRDLLAHPVETFDGVAETLEQLKPHFRLVVITKGDLFDQERKLAASGVDHFFDAVEIVSEKNAAAYARIFARHGEGAARSAMVGNSLKSDILPALEAGAHAIHIPSEHSWALDHADAPGNQERFLQVGSIGDLAGLFLKLEA